MSHLHILAELNPQPGREAELRDGLRALIEPSRAEAGCLRYIAYETDHDGRLYVDEIWESQAALDAHAATDHFQRFAARFPEIVQGDLAIYRLRTIEPSSAPGEQPAGDRELGEGQLDQVSGGKKDYLPL